MTNKNVLVKINTEYEILRTKAASERKRRINTVYKACPKVKKIDDEIGRLGFENMNNILKNPSDKDKYNKEFSKKLKELTEEKNKILSENHIDLDFDKYRYQCDICHDTGYDDNGNKCKCFKQKLIDAAYDLSNMSDMIKEQNFDNFSFDYYSKEKGGESISPYDNMVKIFKKCKDFCENYDDENKSLLFYGDAGLGKTFLSSSIAKEIMDKGKTVLYVRATKLFATYEDYRFGRNTDRNIIDNIYDCDLLIIDDLGTEQTSAGNVSFLFEVINDRITKGKKMIINTNFSLSEITKTYSERLTSRMYEFFNMYKFYGEDIRLQKLKNSLV